MSKPELKVEGQKLVVTAALDPNGDGQPVATVRVEVDLLEIPDEAMSVILKKKAGA
jgi:hypothetical protein